MSTDIDDVPFDVEDEIEVGDLSEQEGGVLPAAQRVIGEIKKASVKRSLLDNKYPEASDNPCTFKYLNLEVAIGPDGIDGQGTYAGKHLFTGMMDIILTYDEEACRRKKEAGGGKFNPQWWSKEARYGAKQFFKAISGDVKNVKVNDDLLLSLPGMPIMFDIKKEKDTFKGEGEFRNTLANFRAVETQED